MSKEYIKNGLIDNRHSIPNSLLLKGEPVFPDKNSPIEKSGKEIKESITVLRTVKKLEVDTLKTQIEDIMKGLTDEPTDTVKDDVLGLLVFNDQFLVKGETTNPFIADESEEDKIQNKLKQDYNDLIYKCIDVCADIRNINKIESLVKDNQKIVLSPIQAKSLGF